MARKKNREMNKTKIEIIPMIDTMFFLLVFFILSSVGITKLAGINMDLPQVSSSSTPPTGPPPVEVTITITANKKVFVNKTQVAGNPPNIGPLLQREIDKRLGAHPDLTRASVIISADPSVPQGMVVTCIDQARQDNVTNFAIATVGDEASATDTKK
jgi:biopolymer transport protein ExbD